MNYKCPKCDNHRIHTLKGWKHHMTRSHGGYDDQELAAATGSVEEGTARERMLALAPSVPESGSEAPSAAPSEAEAPTTQTPAPTRRDAAQREPAPEPEKRVKVSPKKLRKLISTLPVEWFDRQGITLDEEDKDAVEEAVEFLQEVFGVEFAVPAEKYVVRSRLWAMLWPIGVFLFIFFKHKTKDALGKMFGETKPQEKKVEKGEETECAYDVQH